MIPRTRPVLTAMVILVFCGVFSGCGPGTKDSGSAIRLTVWENYNNEEHKVFLEVVDDFVTRKRKQGVALQIEVGRVPFDGLLPKLKAACLTNTTPDICRIDCAHVVPLAYGNAIVALDREENLSSSDLDRLRGEYVTAAIDSCLFRIRRKGEPKASRHLYGLPDQTNCLVLFYNPRLFEARAKELRSAHLDPAKAPATWDEFVRYGRVLTFRRPDGQWQYAVGLNNTLWWSLPFFNTHGARFMEQNQETGSFRCVLDDPLTIQAFSFKANLSLQKYPLEGGESAIEARAWAPAAVTPDQGFQNGIYAMVLSGPWNLKTFREAKVPFKLALIPRGPKGTSSTVGGTDLVVFRSCKHPKLASEFLRFVTSEAVQTLWCSRLGQIPVRPSLFTNASLTQGREELKVFFEQLLTTQARPPVPNYDKIEELAGAEMALALQGVKTPEGALKDAAERINREIVPGLTEP